MSKLMKKARDIRLIGLGLVIGMVLGYLLNFEEPSPPTTGTATMTLAQTPRKVAPPNEEAEIIDVKTVNRRWLRWDDQFGPRPDERRLRIVPARRIDSQIPGGVQHYDLIDLNYVPDFKLPEE